MQTAIHSNCLGISSHSSPKIAGTLRSIGSLRPEYGWTLFEPRVSLQTGLARALSFLPRRSQRPIHALLSPICRGNRAGIWVPREFIQASGREFVRLMGLRWDLQTTQT